MTDRVRMKSLTVLNNPIITSHAEGVRADQHTVIEGDEFSTSEEHAKELEASGYAERTSGKAEAISDDAGKIVGFQKSNNDAISSNRGKAAKADAVDATVTV